MSQSLILLINTIVTGSLPCLNVFSYREPVIRTSEIILWWVQFVSGCVKVLLQRPVTSGAAVGSGGRYHW